MMLVEPHRLVPLTEAWAGKPTVAILLQIEDGQPQVMFLGAPAEKERTLRWITSQPQLLELLERAIALSLRRS